MPELTVVAARDVAVWRIGYRPDPWAWAGWEWASNGRFHGRWDDPEGRFRTIYAGSSLLACLLEALACFRPDPLLADDMAEIIAEGRDDQVFPTVAAGQVPTEWFKPRMGASGLLSGQFCAVSASESVAALHPRFARQAQTLGLHDFDAAALKDVRARTLTQSIAAHLFGQTPLNGIQFASRHGDDLTLWAIFERPDDGSRSNQVTPTATQDLEPHHPDVQRAFDILGLRSLPQVPSARDTSPTDSKTTVPLPLVLADDEEAFASFFPDGNPTPATPLGAAWLWWGALEDPKRFRTVLSDLSANPAVWGDFAEAAGILRRLGIMQHPIESQERPGDVAYVKFIDSGDSTARVFAEAPLEDVWILTMVKVGPLWKVWGLSNNYLPGAADIFRP
jgi:hypothetical protein